MEVAMIRTLAILMAVAMLVPVVFADDIPQNSATSNQTEQPEHPIGTMTGTGIMMPSVQPETINTPVNPNPMMPAMMNGMEVSEATPLAGLFDLGLSAKQVAKLIDLRAKLWKDQIPGRSCGSGTVVTAGLRPDQGREEKPC
jgi:hypothetical protein